METENMTRFFTMSMIEKRNPTCSMGLGSIISMFLCVFIYIQLSPPIMKLAKDCNMWYVICNMFLAGATLEWCLLRRWISRSRCLFAEDKVLRGMRSSVLENAFSLRCQCGCEKLSRDIQCWIAGTEGTSLNWTYWAGGDSKWNFSGIIYRVWEKNTKGIL